MSDYDKYIAKQVAMQDLQSQHTYKVTSGRKSFEQRLMTDIGALFAGYVLTFIGCAVVYKMSRGTWPPFMDIVMGPIQYVLGTSGSTCVSDYSECIKNADGFIDENECKLKMIACEAESII